MKIYITGDDRRYEELRKKLGNENFEIIRFDNAEEDLEEIVEADIIFDLNFDDDASNLPVYASFRDRPVFVSAVKTTLAEAAYRFGDKIRCKLIGINAIPGFIHRDRWEVSLLYKFHADDVQKVMNQLQTEFDIVEDRVGMVTPRIVFMIINEAAFTLQEGTASIEDIDVSMRLGTNYPMGPFAWCDATGITDVFETLMAVYEDTKDPRYKICPLIKTKYLKNQTFYKNA